MSCFSSGFLLAAKALGAKDWSNPKALRLARHMAHEGATVDEIAAAVGWTCCHTTAVSRLQKMNIQPGHNKHARQVRRDGVKEPYLSRSPPTSMKSYRPRKK